MKTFVVAVSIIALSGICLAGGSEDKLIANATRNFVRSNSVVSQFEVKVEKVVGDYARVQVIPRAGQTDSAWVFLKRENGLWRGLTIGTAFTPEDYQQFHIPKELQL